MSQHQERADSADGVPVEATKSGKPPKLCPMCQGQFPRIGRVWGTEDIAKLRYVLPEDEPDGEAWLQSVPMQRLSIRALRVCLECGFVGLFASKDDLRELRRDYR